jgi:hypothetical protein
MGEHQCERRDPERRSFADERTIDVNDAEAIRFWSEQLGVGRDELLQAIKEVGPNTTAVMLKLEAPPTNARL